jgi:hypothetical protein
MKAVHWKQTTRRLTPLRWRGASLVVFAVACGGGSDNPVVTGPLPGGCVSVPSAARVATYRWAVGGGVFTGIKATWDSELGVIVLGPEATGQPVGGVTMTIGAPVAVSNVCTAEVRVATVSTTDVRVGTGPELNGKFYELIPGGCAGAALSILRFDGYGQSAVRAVGCIRMQRVIITPTDPPVRAEIIDVDLEFTALRR